MSTQHLTISRSDKMALISNMATMLAAGISILEIIDSLLEDARGNQKKMLEIVKEDMSQGKHLYASFERFGGVFDKVTVNIIKAAEQAGTLETSLKDLRENIKKESEFMDKVKGALTYPILIMIVFAGVLLMILTFVIPKISAVFLRMRVQLPLPTKMLIFLSNLILTYTVPLLLVLGAVLLLSILLLKTRRRLVLNLIFSLPLISNLAREIDLTRFTRSLYLLLSAGIPIVEALELSKGVLLKKEIVHAVDHCIDVVTSGRRLSEGLKDNKRVIPSIMIRITEAGERSGSLDRSMQEVSEYMDYQVTRTLASVTALLEPIMLVIVGVLVGGMMLSIISPIYGLVGQVTTR